MWCMVTSSTWSCSARRSNRPRISGPVDDPVEGRTQRALVELPAHPQPIRDVVGRARLLAHLGDEPQPLLRERQRYGRGTWPGHDRWQHGRAGLADPASEVNQYWLRE